MNKYQPPPLTEDVHVDTVNEPAYGIGPTGRRLEQGECIGQYTIINWLGDGGMASVYLAEDPTSQRVALKIIAHLGEITQARIEREARVQMQFKHPHIVPMTRLFEHQGTWVMVMEYISGGSLTEWLTTAPTLEQRLRVFEQLCHATAYAHQHGVVHRDLKPSNVLFRDPQSRTPHALVTDFGIAKSLQHDQDTLHTRTGVILGTPGYMAPEQFQAGEPIDQRADIYALGVILYEFCCDVRPFTGQDIFEIAAQCKAGRYTHPLKHAPKLDPQYAQIIETCLRVDPNQRFEHVEALLLAMDAVLNPPTPQSNDWPLATRIAVGVSVVAVAIIIAMALSWPQSTQPPSQTKQVDQRRLLAQAHIDKLTAKAYQLAQHRPAQAVAVWRTVAHLQQQLHGKTSVSLAHFEALRWRGGASMVLPQDDQIWRTYWSKDGNTIYIVTINGELIHQNAHTGEVLHTTTLFKDTRVDNVLLTSDKRYLFVAANGEYNSATPPVQIYDTVENRLKHDIPIHKFIAPRAILIPNTHTALLSNVYHQIQHWDIGQKTMLKNFTELEPKPNTAINCIAMSDDQKQVAITKRPNTVHLSRHNQLKVYTMPFGNLPQCAMRFSRDGKHLAIASTNGNVLIDLNTHKIQYNPKTKSRAILDLGDATLHFNIPSSMWRVPWTNPQNALEYKGHRGNVIDAVSDDQFIYSSAVDRTIRVWSKHEAQQQRVLYGHQSWVFDLDLYEAQNKLVSSSRDHTVRIFNNLNPHRQYVSLDKDVKQWLWSNDGQTLFGRTQTHKIIQLNRRDGFKSTTITQLDNPIHHMQLSGNMLLVSTQNKQLLGFNGLKKQLDTTLQYQSNPNSHYFAQVQTILTNSGYYWNFQSLDEQKNHGQTISPQFTTRAFVAADESLAFFPSNKKQTVVVTPSTKLQWYMTHERAQPANIKTTPDGRYAAIGFWSGGVEIWDLKTKKRIKTLVSNQGSITHLAMTKDHLVAGGAKGTVWLWSVPDFKRIKTFQTHHGDILGLAIDPTHQFIASAGRDKQIHVFSIATPDAPQHHVFHTPSTVRHMKFHPQDRTLSAITTDQNLWNWALSTTNTTSDLLKQTGGWTNLRMCQHSGQIVPVVPFPSPTTIYAPERACKP